jgi:hypothetical protein
MVGLAGLEPAASSLSEIDGRPLCYPAFPLVVPINEDHRDGVNDGEPRNVTAAALGILVLRLCVDGRVG